MTVVDTDLVAPTTPCRPDAGTVLARQRAGSDAWEHGRRLLGPRSTAPDPVAIVWTSGSTGVPKGAVFDHANLRAVAAGTDVLSHPGDRRLSPLPFAHVGYMTRAWDEIAHGVTTVITPQPWTAASAIELLQHRAGHGRPGRADAVGLDAGPPRSRAPPTCRACGSPAPAASRVPPELVRAMRERLGCPVVVRYTSTESSLGTGTRPDDDDEVVATTVGRPVPGVELEVVGEDGEPVAARRGGHGSGCGPTRCCAATSATSPQGR